MSDTSIEINDGDILNLAEIIHKNMLNANPGITRKELERRVQIIREDIVLVARCAKAKRLISYSDITALRGRGSPRDGRWLDDVYYYAVAPLGFPDLTLLVVKKATLRPSEAIFEAGYTKLSKIPKNEVPVEQQRCAWFMGYEKFLGPLVSISPEYLLGEPFSPPPAKEREIDRAVANAICRVTKFGVRQTSIGKEYPNSASRPELVPLVHKLWEQQNGRCALTGQAFERRSDEDGGVQDDRMSLDRIDNTKGYSDGNVQLVTQFANRARGTLHVDEARRRLVQFN